MATDTNGELVETRPDLAWDEEARGLLPARAPRLREITQCLFTTKTETPHSLLWLAAIQIVVRKLNLPSLAPKNCFIATETVEGIIGQIAEPQKTTCELNIRSNLALG